MKQYATRYAAGLALLSVYTATAGTANVTHMASGRIDNLPVSWFYSTVIQTSGVLHVRTRCEGSNDTGVIVQHTDRANFNDDAAQTGGNGLGSYVVGQLGTGVQLPGPPRYTVFVFSMRRATSHCTASYSTDGGLNWQVLAEDEFGGALVDVGPLREKDFLEVATIPYSTEAVPGYDNDTHMVLFDPADSAKGALYNNDQNSSDWDPRIVINNAAGWPGLGNYLLVGKVRRSGAVVPGVETRVQLIRGPLDSSNADAIFPAVGGQGAQISLSPGRYHAWIYAATNSPVGHPEPRPNLSSAMPFAYCAPIDVSGRRTDHARGTFNEVAFTLRAARQTASGSWAPHGRSRRIPLAALGTSPGGGWNLFLLELDVQQAGPYRLETSGEIAGLSFSPEWHVVRNADTNQLTVATFNTFYRGSYQEQKTRNASNLLATRGNIHPADLKVEMRADQATWQWEADIIGLQELTKKYAGPQPGTTYDRSDVSKNFGLADVFVEEAQQRGSRSWSYVKGRDEYWYFENPLDTAGPGLGPLFIADNATPGTSNRLYFSQAAKSHAGCSGDTLDYAECSLGPSWIFDNLNYAVPGKAAARRFGPGADRPVAVFNVHLQSGDYGAAERKSEMQDLISIITRLLEADPGAFNNDSQNSDRRNPRFYQNRIIILGDMNISAHACGEHQWLLHQLREQFGYAVDVSQARDITAIEDHFGMHDKLGSFALYQSYQDWRKSPDLSMASRYPWWASTFRGDSAEPGEKGERYDAIFLVGKGWAYDDPVQDYMVMPDRDSVSPLNPSGGGVEMYRGAELVFDGGNNYAPNHSLGYGTSAGKPALHSDHQPVGARLRIFLR